jgi:hypothetical protein|nr:MAG TPA: hypothetical protein [Caudoviricetes sp.]
MNESIELLYAGNDKNYPLFNKPFKEAKPIQKGSFEIQDFFEEHYIKDRDQKVVEQIYRYLSNNHDAMLDGLLKDFIVFGSTNEARITNLYDITTAEWNKFKGSHPLLKKDFKVSGSLLRMGLIISYYKTRDRIFLDFLAVTIFGSRWKQYFRHNVKEHVMKYVIEKKLTMKSYFKQYGSAYVALQETISTILQGENASDSKRITAILQTPNDQNIIDLVNTIYSRINSLLNTLASHYYAAEKEEKSGYILSVSDEAEEGRLSLSNNSLKISNLKSMVDNLTSTSLDELILKTLRLETPIRRGCVTSVLCNTKEKIFSRYANIYIDYYVKTHGTDWNKMKQQFITKSNTARMKDPLAKELDSRIMKLIREFIRNYTKYSNEDPEDLKTSNGIVKLTKTIKDYIIIKTRALMNDL